MLAFRKTFVVTILVLSIFQTFAKSVKDTESSKAGGEGESKVSNATTTPLSKSKNITQEAKNFGFSNRLRLNATKGLGNKTTSSIDENEKDRFKLTNKEKVELSLGLVPAADALENNSTLNSTSTPTSSTVILTTEISVTSQPLELIKKAEENLTNSTSSAVVAFHDGGNKSDSKNTSEYDYKKKVKPSFIPYIDEILNNDSINNATTNTSGQSRMKVETYASNYNDVLAKYPYGSLPTFSGIELGKLRLNHWRVNQILRGSVDVEAEKMGLPGTRKEILKEKYPYPQIGQKRAAINTSPVPTYLDDSAADSFSSLLTSVDQDNAAAADQSSAQSTTPSKLRTFLSWFKNGKHENDKSGIAANPRRMEELKAQQSILPLALDYRGDFLFW